MAGRTIAIGDIHGDFVHLTALVDSLPTLSAGDTMVFVGDYVDRGPQSKEVVDFLRTGLPSRTKAKIVLLRGNHEDGWIKVRRQGWVEFALPSGNGCLPTLRSFRGQPMPKPDELPGTDEFKALLTGTFFPQDVVPWMESLPVFYEDEHAIYVHAGLPKVNGRWAHPSELTDPKPLMWQRTEEFYRSYQGKRVVFGHTVAEALPQELSGYTAEDKTDVFCRDNLIGLDTRCGHGGFLTAVELPKLVIYESRRVLGRSS
jgi:serine/threonine protein phosphatase 1